MDEGAGMLICKGRDFSVNPNLVCLFAFSWVKNTSQLARPQLFTALVLNYNCQVLVLLILQVSNNNNNQNPLNSSFNSRNILHFNSTSTRQIWRDFDTDTSKHSNAPQNLSLLLNSSFFSTFIKNSKINTKDLSNY